MAKPDGGKSKASFFREVKSELKKVTYPTPAQTRKNTFTVIAIVLLVGVYIWALDFCFVNALSLVLEGRPAIQLPVDSESQEQDTGEAVPEPSSPPVGAEVEELKDDSGEQNVTEQQPVEEVAPSPEISEPGAVGIPQGLPENSAEPSPGDSLGGAPDAQ